MMKSASAGSAIGPPCARTMMSGLMLSAARGPSVDARRTILQHQGGLRANRSARGQAEMADDDICARDRHGSGLLFAEDIRRRQQVLLVCPRDHLDLERVGHSGFLEI